jgi:hypothetical protein
MASRGKGVKATGGRVEVCDVPATPAQIKAARQAELDARFDEVARGLRDDRVDNVTMKALLSKDIGKRAGAAIKLLDAATDTFGRAEREVAMDWVVGVHVAKSDFDAVKAGSLGVDVLLGAYGESDWREFCASHCRSYSQIQNILGLVKEPVAWESFMSGDLSMSAAVELSYLRSEPVSVRESAVTAAIAAGGSVRAARAARKDAQPSKSKSGRSQKRLLPGASDDDDVADGVEASAGDGDGASGSFPVWVGMRGKQFAEYVAERAEQLGAPQAYNSLLVLMRENDAYWVAAQERADILHKGVSAFQESIVWASSAAQELAENSGVGLDAVLAIGKPKVSVSDIRKLVAMGAKGKGGA